MISLSNTEFDKEYTIVSQSWRLFANRYCTGIVRIVRMVGIERIAHMAYTLPVRR